MREQRVGALPRTADIVRRLAELIERKVSLKTPDKRVRIDPRRGVLDPCF